MPTPVGPNHKPSAWPCHLLQSKVRAEGTAQDSSPMGSDTHPPSNSREKRLSFPKSGMVSLHLSYLINRY
ncbi:hypothetical protein DSO57_1015678 [Entomophthora muscae]|uniref:Uncharacterized protein n=1 Tax=Entomophthora muscae TaxID=34485 RepID=A0ACC2UQ56_9FUNG|nr:hypothetical protein DSO57_1015678 [Entomophthora muscae]